MTPDSMANEVEEQKLLLKQYLGQYYYAKMKKKQLEARLRAFRENMLGTKGMQYSPVPRSQTNSVGDGPATQVIRAMEIEDRIESQKAEMAKTMLNVMKIMDFLPTDSTERSILEYRHIDCLSWKQVCKEANMTRTPCNKYYNAGIDKLLTYKKVQSILQEFASSRERCVRQLHGADHRGARRRQARAPRTGRSRRRHGRHGRHVLRDTAKP